MYNGSISTLHITGNLWSLLQIRILVAYCVEWDQSISTRKICFWRWYKKYYPEATNYKWQKWNVRPTEFNTKFMKQFLGRYLGCCDGQIQRFTTQSNNMNPFIKWYEEMKV